MAKFAVGDGIDNYIKQLEKLHNGSEPGLKYAVYFGAEKIADAVRNEIEALPTGRANNGQIMPSQKRGLLEGLGISKMQNEDGFVNVRIGFDGYSKVKTKRFPKGQPNALIARSIISGTSFRRKNNFIQRAVSRSRKDAEEAMRKALDSYVQEKIK